MGIQGLLPFLKKSSRPVKLSEFKGKTAAVDVYCWLHKGAFSCAEKLVKGEPTDGYIVFVMKQVNLLLSYNIKPILVFDGCRLPAKEGTESKRRENRIKNRRKAQELLREGKIKEARECFQRCVDITSTMAHETIKACRARNIDTIVAPYEADSQLAFLNQKGIADVVITEDSDLILFGCDKIIFKLDNNGGGVLVEREKLHCSMNVPRDRFDFNKFRNMCILSGCDYLPSLHGVGLVKACRFFLVTSNPDVFTALCKLPTNLKMPHLEVTLEYRESFMKAINTLLYQLVFDPITRTLRPLTSYPPDTDHQDMPYCGKFLGHERAYEIALGNVDVQTGETVDHYDPLTSERPDMKSSSWTRIGDVVSHHPSMWDPDYETLIKNWSESENKVEESLMRGKKCVVDVSILKRKREAVSIGDKEEISEEFLESVYSSKKLKSSEEDEKITEEDSPLTDLKEESESLPNSSSIIDDEIMSCYQQENGALTEHDSEKNSKDDFISDSSIFTQLDKAEVVQKTPSRNPFAKKSGGSNSENINPLKRERFSVLKRISTPVIVRSRYFKTEEDEHIEKEPTNDAVIDFISSPTKEQNCSKIIAVESTEETCSKSPMKSPLKPKNEIEDSPQNKNVQKGSFNWGSKRLSQQFSFTPKEKLSAAIKQDCVKISHHSPPELNIDTPPPSQNEETSYETKSTLSELNKLDPGPDKCVLNQLTPEEDKKQDGRSPLKRSLKSDSIPTPKCRVSGLKKPSSKAGKQKQLNLKDMFAFKKDAKKIATMQS